MQRDTCGATEPRLQNRDGVATSSGSWSYPDVSEGEEKTIDQTDVKDILLKIAGLNLPVTQLPIKQVTVPAEENISEADDPAANAVSDSSVSDKTVANKETTPTSANHTVAHT